MVFKLFYMNTLHLFSHCGDAPADQTCCVQQRRLRERSGFDAELMTWTLQLPTGGMGAAFEYSNVEYSELPGRVLVRQRLWAFSVT